MSSSLQRLKAVLTREIIPPLPEAVRRRIRIGARWLSWALLALFILGVIAWTVLNVVSAERMETTLSSLRQSGFGLRMSELAPPVPPEENAAPLYTAAFALVSRPRSPAEQEAYEHAVHEGVGTLSPGQKDLIRSWLERNADAFELAARARRRPLCRFPREYEGYATRYPEMAPILWLSGALSVRAQWLANGNNLPAARDSVGDIFRLADTVKDEPTVLCQYVRQAALANALETIAQCVTPETDLEALRDWLAMLPRERDLDGSMERPFRGELAVLAESLPLTAEDLRAFSGPRKDPDPWEALLIRLSYPIQRLDGIATLNLLRRAAEISRKPYLEGQAEWSALAEEIWKGSLVLHPIRHLVMPGLSRILETQARLQARIAITRTGLEWESEHLAKGRYPDRVETPDPFTGKPLVYTQGEGKIRSAGPSQGWRPSDEGHTWTLRHKR